MTKDGNRIPIELNTRTLEYKGEFMGLEGVARVIENKRRVLLTEKRLLEELRMGEEKYILSLQA